MRSEMGSFLAVMPIAGAEVSPPPRIRLSAKISPIDYTDSDSGNPDVGCYDLDEFGTGPILKYLDSQGKRVLNTERKAKFDSSSREWLLESVLSESIHDITYQLPNAKVFYRRTVREDDSPFGFPPHETSIDIIIDGAPGYVGQLALDMLRRAPFLKMEPNLAAIGAIVD